VVMVAPGPAVSFELLAVQSPFCKGYSTA
jgi:hypothetical protein